MTPTSDRFGQVTIASAIGERPRQEDRAVQEWIDLPSAAGWLLAVFDGHRGPETAEKASRTLPELFRSQLQLNQGNPEAALRETFGALGRMTSQDFSGSTASVVFISRQNAEVCWAVLGDSPVALQDSEGRIRIGPEHNVRTNLSERSAAERRGGIYRGGYLEDRQSPGAGLQMSRALGDADLSRILDRRPEIERISLGHHGIVLVGTDGLFGPLAEDQGNALALMLALIREGADAESIVQEALRRRTGDNATAIVWKS